MIEASLPGLHKERRVIAIRETGESERSEYTVRQSDGDMGVTQEVIAPYLAEEQQIEDLPISSVMITPVNYKFRYAGEARIDGTLGCVFRISPQKKRRGLIRGELWLDSATGIAVMQAGSFVKPSSAGIRRINFVRTTKLQNGRPHSRITRVAIRNAAGETRILDAN